MKKMLTVLAAVAFLATAAFAQEEGASKGGMPVILGAELGLGIAMDDNLDDADFGDRVGFPIINLRGMFLLQNVPVGANPLAVGAHVGYDRFFTVDEAGVEMSLSIVPILAVAQMRPIAQPLYVEAGLGFALAMAHVEMDLGPWGGTMDEDSSELEFGLMLGAGYAIALNEKMEIPVGARFLMIFDEGSAKQLQITAGFNYSL